MMKLQALNQSNPLPSPPGEAWFIDLHSLAAWAAVAQAAVGAATLAVTFVFYRLLVKNDTIRTGWEIKLKIEREVFIALDHAVLNELRVVSEMIRLRREFPKHIETILGAYEKKFQRLPSLTTPPMLLLKLAQEEHGKWPTPDEWQKRRQEIGFE